MKAVLHGGGNSLAGLRRAHALGLTTVEADVMLCFRGGQYDGALCVHPAALSTRRTTEGHLDAARSEAAAAVERATGAAPLMFEELLSQLAALGMRALLEIKVGGTVARIGSALRGADVTVLSFVGRELEAAAEANLPRGCLIKHDPSPRMWNDLQRTYRLTMYAPDHWYLSAETVALARAAGVEVVSWDVDDVARARTLQAMGVDAVMSNHPEGLLQAGVCAAG